jgi:hypothetical protein
LLHTAALPVLKALALLCGGAAWAHRHGASEQLLRAATAIGGHQPALSRGVDPYFSGSLDFNRAGNTADWWGAGSELQNTGNSTAMAAPITGPAP